MAGFSYRLFTRFLRLGSLCFLMLVLSLTSHVSFAQSEGDPTELIARDLLFGHPEKFQGRISPDGNYVSWLAPVNGVQNVWVAPANDVTEAYAVTTDTGRGIQNHMWTFDGASILYLQDNGGDENDHVYLVNIKSKQKHDLTPMPQGKKAMMMAMSADKPELVVVATNERNGQLFDLYTVNLKTREKTLLAENPGFADWVIDKALQPRVALKLNEDGSGTLMKRADDGWAAILDVPEEDVINSEFLGISSDNNHAYLLSSMGRDKKAVFKVNIDSGEWSIVASGEKADIASVFIHPSEKHIVGYSENYLRSTWHSSDKSYQAHFDAISRQAPGDVEVLAATSDATQWVVYSDAPTHPARYYLYATKDKTLREMFATRPALNDAPLQPMHAQVVDARDGLKLTTYLTLPIHSDPDNNGKPRSAVPMVLTVHGGPWARDYYGYNAWHQWLANRGYAVLSVNYRGSTGFGKTFTNAAVKEFAGKMHDDLIDAVNWAIEQGIAKPDKVAIMGGSYGGYATLTGVTFTPDTFACGVDLVGPSSLVTLIESFPDYWKPFLSASWYKFVGNPAIPAEREDMLARSAISRIDDIKVPLLIGQGENDPRVTKLESDQIVDKMKKMNKPVTYVNYPDEGHGFVRPENRKSFYAITEGFLADCLGGDYQPIGNDFAGSSLQVLAGAKYVRGLEKALSRHDSGTQSE